MNSDNKSSTIKRKNTTSPPPVNKVARQSFSASQIQQSIKDIIATDLNDLVQLQLNGILPQMVESIQAAVLETVEKKIDEFLVTLNTKLINNAPPPPPSPLPIMPTVSQPLRHKSKAEVDLSNLCHRRTRPFYQQLRHNGLADLFTSSMENEDPVLPRKFAEKVGKFDQPAIVQKKRQMTIQNVMNEIEILKIFAQNDKEKLTKIDQEAADIVSSLPHEECQQMKDFYTNIVNASEKKSNEIWGKKLKFLTSDKYLLPLSQLIVENNDNSKLINSSFINKTNNFNFQYRQNFDPSKTNNSFNDYHSKNDRTYCDIARYNNHHMIRQTYETNDNYENDNYDSFQKRNQNFRRRQTVRH